MDLPMNNDIDFAPTTDGGRVRLSTVVSVLPPQIFDDPGQHEVPVLLIDGKGPVFIGPFTSEKAALRWVDVAFPAWRLP